MHYGRARDKLMARRDVTGGAAPLIHALAHEATELIGAEAVRGAGVAAA
jgi:hypothetical protein